MILCVPFIRLSPRFTGVSRFVPLGYHYFCIRNLRLSNSNYLRSGPQPAQHSRRSQLIAKACSCGGWWVGFRLGSPENDFKGLGFESGFLPEFESQNHHLAPPPNQRFIIRWNHLSLKEKHVRALLHPGRLTWNLKMMVWKMIFLFNWVIFRFHVNLPGCRFRFQVSKKPTPKVCQDER